MFCVHCLSQLIKYQLCNHEDLMHLTPGFYNVTQYNPSTAEAKRQRGKDKQIPQGPVTFDYYVDNKQASEKTLLPKLRGGEWILRNGT